MTRDELARRVHELLLTTGEPPETMEVSLRSTEVAWVAVVTRPDAVPHLLDACAMGPTETDAREGAWRQIVRRIDDTAQARRALLGIAEHRVAKQRRELHRAEELQAIIAGLA